MLPPRVAHTQVVIIPIPNTKMPEAEKRAMMDQADKLRAELQAQGLRVKTDARDIYTPGWKYNYWELQVRRLTHVGLDALVLCLLQASEQLSAAVWGMVLRRAGQGKPAPPAPPEVYERWTACSVIKGRAQLRGGPSQAGRAAVLQKLEPVSGQDFGLGCVRCMDVLAWDYAPSSSRPRPNHSGLQPPRERAGTCGPRTAWGLQHGPTNAFKDL